MLAARGEFDQAEELARDAVGLCAEAQTLNFQGDASVDLARVLRTAGKLEQAAVAAREALALFERKGNDPAAGITRAFIEELR